MSDHGTDAVIGRAADRVDGPLKVAGRARFAAEFNPPGLCYAALVQSTIPRGRIRSIDSAPALRTPGVLAVLTHVNAPRLPERGMAAVNPPAGRVLSLLQDDVVHYNGQPIAVVVADTFEHAVEASALVRVAYAAETPVLRFDDAKLSAYLPKEAGRGSPERSWGDVEAGLAAAAVRIDAVYTTPMEHHNPFEESILDTRYGRFVNGNLADYHVPVNADIGRIDVTFVDESDLRFNPIGARGIGEIGITGVAGALANAVYHATGKRVRDLPITLDKLL